MKTEGRRSAQGSEPVDAVGTVEAEPIDAWGVQPAIGRVDVGMVLGGRYEVRRSLGSGGSGQVFAAFDRVLSERVALKVLHADRAGRQSWIRRLTREVKIARLIRHPNVCRVFELGNEDGFWFVTLELADGGTLRDVLDRRRDAEEDELSESVRGPIWQQRLAEARAVCAGLAAIHAVGIVHRDVTPQNVLRMSEGRLVLSDFGLAVGTLESTTFLGGTPRYMAPEVLAGRRADQRSDVYQLGLLLHEILFGRRAEWHDVVGRSVLKPPVSPHDSTPVEEELAALCADCLSANPDGRPASAVAVAGRLAAAEQARPRGRWARAWRRAARVVRAPLARWAAAAIVLLAVGAQAGRVALRPRLCSGGPARVAGAWGPANKDALRRTFFASGKAGAASMFDNVSRLLDEHARRWLAAYTDACEATQVRGEQSAEVLGLRMACLNDDLESMSALTRVLTQADATVVGNAVAAAAHLDDLTRCADVEHLRRGVALPKDPLVRQKAARLRHRLLEAGALRDSGQYEKSRSIVEAVLAESDPITTCAAHAEALEIKAECLATSEDNKQAAIRLAEQSAFTAEGCGHDRVVAVSSANLVFFEGRTDPASAERWGEISAAALKRLGGDKQIEGWLLNNLGVLRLWQGRFEEARDLSARALALKETTLDPEGFDVAISRTNLAYALSKLGRHDEALAVAKRGLDGFGRAVGTDSDTYARPLSDVGEMLFAAGEIEPARKAFIEALRIFQDYQEKQNAAFPMVGLGRIAVSEGDFASAVKLCEEALHAREADATMPGDLADTRFCLARALGGERKEGPRSRQLAHQALAVYAGSPGYDRERRDVERWLAKGDGERTARPGR